MTSKTFMPEGQYDTVAIMAPGPSLTKEQVNAIMKRGIFTIAIGDAYLLNPFADILYHCDRRWWMYYKGVPEFHGCQRVSMEDVPAYPEIKQVIQSPMREGLALQKPYIVAGANSGHQAINLAFHYHPKRIILVGYDMKKAPDGQYNVRGQHPVELKSLGKFSKFMEKIATLRAPLAQHGVTVYNCTIDTDLQCFAKRDLEDVLSTEG